MLKFQFFNVHGFVKELSAFAWLQFSAKLPLNFIFFHYFHVFSKPQPLLHRTRPILVNMRLRPKLNQIRILIDSSNIRARILQLLGRLDLRERAVHFRLLWFNCILPPFIIAHKPLFLRSEVLNTFLDRINLIRLLMYWIVTFPHANFHFSIRVDRASWTKLNTKNIVAVEISVATDILNATIIYDLFSTDGDWWVVTTVERFCSISIFNFLI